jgi:DNA processing protein
MIQEINFHINQLEGMRKYPHTIYFMGNTQLLKKRIVSIVGTRKPNNYSKLYTSLLAKKLSDNEIVIASGVAMGVDAIAHQNSFPNTIAVAANGLNIRYPVINKNLISKIEKEALIISAYSPNSSAKGYTFVERNEIVVALGEVLIITEADLNSGSLRSAEFALKMGKKIYVLPHRIGESEGTNQLILKGLATPIYDLDQFLESLGCAKESEILDDFLNFCSRNPTYEAAVALHGGKVFEYELLGKIVISNGIIRVC